MELTREEAIRLHRELWKWLAENPMKRKEDWPGWDKIEPVRHWCPCCEYVKYDWNIETCKKKCPLEWKRLRNLSDPPCLCSYYKNWERATAPEERSRLAAIIRDLPEKVEKKPEPRFKPGDKVVPVSKTVHCSLEDCGIWNKAKEMGQPFLYVREYAADGDVILHNNDDVMGYNYLESDLIPYVEPKAETETPAFKPGDRVRV